MRRSKELIREAAEELATRGIPHNAAVPLGVMIETPAAAVAADTFAGEGVSFFSIGTNDLVQYSLAVDRGNVNLANRFTPLHPGVLRLIRDTVLAGERHGIEVAVCGEMASQPLTAFALIGLGVRELSVSPRAVPTIKQIVCGISVQAAREAAEQAMHARNASGAEEALAGRLNELLGRDPLQ